MYWTLVVAIFEQATWLFEMNAKHVKSVAIAIFSLFIAFTTSYALSLARCTFPACARAPWVLWFSFHCSNKNVTHILSLFIVTVTIRASCRRCRRRGGCCCSCLQSHAKWISLSLLSELVDFHSALEIIRTESIFHKAE